MQITKIWFDSNYIFAQFDDGKVLKQSLLWYSDLANASDNEKANFKIGFEGIHWRNLDTDISFESFFYEDAEPFEFQRFFLTHKEVNIPEFANRIGINPSLLIKYINGMKKPYPNHETLILNEIKIIGKELSEI